MAARRSGAWRGPSLLRLALSLSLALLAACGEPAPEPASPEIVVLLQTDLVPGLELERLELFTRPERGARANLVGLTFDAGDDLESAPREIHRLERATLDLARAPTDLVVRALGRAGDALPEWRATLAPHVQRVEVRLFRSCGAASSGAGER